MRVLWLVVAGCQFHPSTAPGDSAGDDATGDGTTTMIDAPIDGPQALPFCATDTALRACFTFDNNLLDGSTHGNDGSGTNQTFTPGAAGMAVVTTAPADLRIANDPSLDFDTFTIRMKIRIDQLPPDAGNRRAGLVENNGYRVFLNTDGSVRCAINDGSTQVITAAKLAASTTFHRVACTFDGHAMVVYFDGTEVGRTTSAQTVLVDTVNTTTTIGQNEPSGENFTGAIDELELWAGVQPSP